MTTTVGAITIGQTPRKDITGELRLFLPPDVRIMEAGALDGLTREQVLDAERNVAGPLLVTLLEDGTEVKIGEHFLMPRIRECILRIEKQSELILMLCTGTFPQMDSRRLVLYPGAILAGIVGSIGPRRAGILTPAREQAGYQLERWRAIVPDVHVEPADPYGSPAQLDAAALNLSRYDPDVLVMDCIGYTIGMKQRVSAVVNRPVLLARSLLGRAAAELLDCRKL